MKQAINRLISLLFLSLSECDGMCQFCKEDLKKACKKRKNENSN